MALKKDIELNNGVIMNYHRIESFTQIVNMGAVINVNSYISEEQREKEKEFQSLQLKNITHTLSEEESKELDKGINVLIENRQFAIPPKDGLTIEDAYKYLKEMEVFKNSIDI